MKKLILLILIIGSVGAMAETEPVKCFKMARNLKGFYNDQVAIKLCSRTTSAHRTVQCYKEALKLDIDLIQRLDLCKE